jgi:hypothetical protein
VCVTDKEMEKTEKNRTFSLYALKQEKQQQFYFSSLSRALNGFQRPPSPSTRYNKNVLSFLSFCHTLHFCFL